MNWPECIQLKIFSNIPPSEWIELNRYSTIEEGVQIFNIRRSRILKGTVLIHFSANDCNILIPPIYVPSKMILWEFRESFVGKSIYGLNKGKPIRFRVLSIEPKVSDKKFMKDLKNVRIGIEF